MPRHIRKDDNVIVNSGKNKGKTGTVLRVMQDRDQVVVQGVNIRTKHVKKSQHSPNGGVIHKEMPIHISNVSPVVDGKATRVRFQTDENGKKVRVAASNGSTIGPDLKKGSKKKKK